jgi:hypothetical protein
LRTVTATIDIDAPPSAVWAVLADLAGYPAWNPVFPQASGELEAGHTITLKTVLAGSRSMTVKAVILAADPGRELRWAGGLRGIISGEHSFILTGHGGGTRLVQSETFSGVLVPFSGRALARAEASYRELNQALADRLRAGDR